MPIDEPEDVLTSRKDMRDWALGLGVVLYALRVCNIYINLYNTDLKDFVAFALATAR